MPSSNSTRFPPAFLLRYNARSARASASSAVSDSLSVVTPKLAVTMSALAHGVEEMAACRRAAESRVVWALAR